MKKLVLLTVTFLFLFSCGFAQDQPSDAAADKAKKKKELDERIVQMLDQSIGDVETLRLPRNRAVVYAVTGDLYWKYDEKRSRELFRSSAGEILIYNQEADKEKRESPYAYIELFDFDSDPRTEILPLVAQHDAELALELLLQTRSAKLADAISKAAQPNAKPASDVMSFNPETQRIKQELALEQQFALLAADENPEKAIKLIKDSLAKGISPNVIPLLQKLFKKDDKKAAELASDVIKKLLDSDLGKNQDDMQVALSFLQFAFKPPAAPAANPKEKQFAFSESQIKDLAGKVADTLLPASRSINMATTLNRAMPMLEKFVPERIAALKQRQAENQANMPPEMKSMQQRQKLWDPNSTPEEILAQVPKMQNDFEKMQAYQSLIWKIAKIEDEARAKKLIDQIPDEKTRTSALEQFEAARISRTASEGKLDDARKMIANLTKKKIQIQRLVALATEFQKKGGEKDLEAAKSLMKDAKALLVEAPEDQEDLNDLMEVVKGYATIDSDTGFRMFEPVVDAINVYLDASATLSRFDKHDTTFKKGELVMKIKGNTWDLLLFRYIPQMQMLAKADLERMNSVADRFGRSDSRLIVKLYVLQGFLQDPKKVADTPQENGIVFMDY